MESLQSSYELSSVNCSIGHILQTSGNMWLLNFFFGFTFLYMLVILLCLYIQILGYSIPRTYYAMVEDNMGKFESQISGFQSEGEF